MEALNIPRRNSTEDLVLLLVGPERHRFLIHKVHLMSKSQYFQQQLMRPVRPHTHSSISPEQVHAHPVPQDPQAFELPNYRPTSIELLVLYLYDRSSLLSPQLLDEGSAGREELQWDLIDLHLLGARIGAPAVQDAAIDRLQDLYLRFNMDLNPSLVHFVYESCEPVESCRLRKWFVAMTAWAFCCGNHSCEGREISDSGKDVIIERSNQVYKSVDCETGHPVPLFSGHIGSERKNNHSNNSMDTPKNKVQALLGLIEDFAADYEAHLTKANASGIELPFKNPQLRLSSNRLRAENREFGFRQCSFHTHRASVGEGPCPHDMVGAIDGDRGGELEDIGGTTVADTAQRVESRENFEGRLKKEGIMLDGRMRNTEACAKARPDVEQQTGSGLPQATPARRRSKIKLNADEKRKIREREKTRERLEAREECKIQSERSKGEGKRIGTAMEESDKIEVESNYIAGGIASTPTSNYIVSSSPRPRQRFCRGDYQVMQLVAKPGRGKEPEEADMTPKTAIFNMYLDIP